MTSRMLLVAALATVAIPVAADAKGKDDHPAKGGSKVTKPAKPKKAKPVPAAIKDCAADGDLDAVYSPGALNNALKRFPADVGTYTDCKDLLRFARAAGPVVPVNKRVARVRTLCIGSAYEVSVAKGTKTIGTATTKSCKRHTRVTKVPVTATFSKRKGRESKGTVTVRPGGKTLTFAVRLTGRKIAD